MLIKSKPVIAEYELKPIGHRSSGFDSWNMYIHFHFILFT